ncbi:MAG: hypothetical protein IJX02_08820 [Clostridia bacterium]|nr:hypothetical protein [Clostridia bacterium]
MKRIVSFLVILTVFLLTSCHDDPEAEQMTDLNLFISEGYAVYSENDESSWWKQKAGVYAKEFFPKYEEIEYEYSTINFFVYTYNHKVVFVDVALILEMSFDDASTYEKAKADIVSNYTFLEKRVRDDDGIGFSMPAPEFQVGDYLVKIITEGAENDSYPTRICAIGLNDDEKAIRYIYLYDANASEISEETFVKTVGRSCNGEW